MRWKRRAVSGAEYAGHIRFSVWHCSPLLERAYSERLRAEAFHDGRSVLDKFSKKKKREENVKTAKDNGGRRKVITIVF